MIKPFHQRSKWLLLAVASITVSCDGQAKGKQMDQPLSVLDEIVESIRAAGTLDFKTVERITDATLRETSNSNDSFAFYEAKGVKSGAYTVGVDLRTPVPGGDATGGALLVLNLSGPCVTRADLEPRFGPLTLTEVPRGESLDEEAHWSRRERWGKLSFGFSSRSPNCLSSVVFTLSEKV